MLDEEFPSVGRSSFDKVTPVKQCERLPPGQKIDGPAAKGGPAWNAGKQVGAKRELKV